MGHTTVRYQLRAYVCACGDVREVVDMGVTTLRQVFHRRPDGCRFAVVSRVRRSDWGDYLSIDLYELKTTTGHDVLLGDHKVFPTYEAAIAAAQMQL